MTPQERPVAGDGLDREAIERLSGVVNGYYTDDRQVDVTVAEAGAILLAREVRRRAVAERSVHGAAVEVMAGALCLSRHYVIGERPCGWCRFVAGKQIAALVASAEVREGLVAALDDVWPYHPWADTADAILAALGGTEAS